MNPTGTPPMDGFERRLLGELREFVQARAASQDRARPTASPRRSRVGPAPRRWLAAGAVATVAGIATLIAFSAGSTPSLAQAFPIFARPATGIPATLLGFLRGDGPTLHDARLDVRHARAIHTPLGTGYVLTDRRANLICVAAPGFDHTGWGAACGTASLGMRLGAGGLEQFGSGHRASLVEVLPRGATATIREPGGARRPLPLPDGVLAIAVHRSSVITTHVAGHVSTTVLRVPYRSRRLPVPTPAQVASPVSLRVTPGRSYPTLSAGFRPRYPARRGESSYGLETDPVSVARNCHQGDSLLAQTSRDVPTGRLTRLTGGAPTCPGRWRVTVYYAVPNGSTVYPGLGWGQPLGGATRAPRGSGEQIVDTRILTVH